MHNKLAETVEFNHGNRSIRKSKSTSNLSVISKKKLNNISSVKIEIDEVEINKSSKINGNTSPNHRRRPKRSSMNSNAILSTIASVHELMSFVVYKDNPPSWLKQTDLYKEYKKKSEQINTENLSSESPPHYHQQLHRKQRCNLQMYARSSHSWQSVSSPTLINSSIDNHTIKRHHSNESIHKRKHEVNLSPMYNTSSSSSSMIDLSLPLNISVKSEPVEPNSMSTPNKSRISKQSTSSVTTRRQHMLCEKKISQNGVVRRQQQRMNSVEDQETLEKKDSSSSSQQDSNTSSSSSSIEHTSPSPTTTVSASSSEHSSPAEYMRGNGSINTRLSSPLRIQTSISPQMQSLSTPQRRSRRIWAPSNFYINPMWIIPTASSSKRLLVQNETPSPSPPPPPSESNKRPRRRCRS